MKRTGIKVRFLTTLVTNVLRVGFSFITGMVIARSLGPGGFGDFNFLMGSFTALANLVDMGSSSAFYTFISRGPRGRKLFIYYGGWILVQLFVLLLVVVFLPGSIKGKIWLGHPNDLILLALLSNFTANQFWRFAGQIGESIRDTVGVQVRNLLLSASYLAGVVLLMWFHLISIKNLFILNFALYLLLAIGYGWRLRLSSELSTDTIEDFGTIFREFRSYCLPLIVVTLVGFVHAFADYWLLQNFGGAVQQGYYAVSAKCASIALIATVSILQVFWKEISEVYAHRDFDRVRFLYYNVTRCLYFGATVISCSFIPFSKEILTLFLGPSYKSAWLSFSIMMFYPIYQSLGQITGIMLLAMGKTKTKSCIDVLFMVVSIPATYFFLAPRAAFLPGLELGAVGLAVKMVICQLLVVSLTIYFVARYIKTPIYWRYQLNVFLLLLTSSFVVKYSILGVISFLSLNIGQLSIIILSLITYLFLISGYLYYFPELAGMNGLQVKQGFYWLREKFIL